VGVSEAVALAKAVPVSPQESGEGVIVGEAVALGVRVSLGIRVRVAEGRTATVGTGAWEADTACETPNPTKTRATTIPMTASISSDTGREGGCLRSRKTS
jgi:hypothetical protein